MSSPEEVLFRNQADFNYGFNCMASAVLETESRLVGDGFMSNHVHSGIQTDYCNEFVEKTRYAYSRYFNQKNHRKGRLGEKFPFILPVEGIKHTLTMLSYVSRQPVHHGITSTPFEYRNSSANAIFRKELGKDPVTDLLKDSHKSKYLPGFIRTSDMSRFRMSRDGVLLREDIIDTDYVEELFITPRSYLYYMNRISDMKWQEEQLEDKIGGDPIKLSMLEPDVFSVERMLQNEAGRIDRNWMTDIQLCELIDNDLIYRFYGGPEQRPSIYLLSKEKRASLGNYILSLSRTGKLVNSLSGMRQYVTKEQVIRCVAINY